MIDSVIVGNIISGIGVFFLIAGHFIISQEKETLGIKLSVTGGLFVGIGAIFLTSWPILGLNIFWIVIGLYGLYERTKKIQNINKRSSSVYVNFLFTTIFLIGIFFSILGNYNVAAWFCTALYLLAFALFSNKYINNLEYMIWTFLGFFLLLEHLIVKHNYSVLINESIGALISLRGVLFHIKRIKKNNSDKIDGIYKTENL
jgi:hypothetical protein